MSIGATIDLWAWTKCTFNNTVLPYVGAAGNAGPSAPSLSTRRSVGYFGAVRLRDGKFFFRRETEEFNAVTCWNFLWRLRAASTRSSRRVVVVTENAKCYHARFHRNCREEHADRFALDYLPPYSPDLNPIERVWKLTRRRCLHNRYFAHPDETVHAVESEFAHWLKPNNALHRLCATA